MDVNSIYQMLGGKQERKSYSENRNNQDPNISSSNDSNMHSIKQKLEDLKMKNESLRRTLGQNEFKENMGEVSVQSFQSQNRRNIPQNQPIPKPTRNPTNTNLSYNGNNSKISSSASRNIVNNNNNLSKGKVLKKKTKPTRERSLNASLHLNININNQNHSFDINNKPKGYQQDNFSFHPEIKVKKLDNVLKNDVKIQQNQEQKLNSKLNKQSNFKDNTKYFKSNNSQQSTKPSSSSISMSENSVVKSRMNPFNLPNDLAKSINIKINEFFNLCFSNDVNNDQVFVDFTQMDRITVCKTDFIQHLQGNEEVKSIFGLNYDLSQVYDLICTEDDKNTKFNTNDIKKRTLFKNYMINLLNDFFKIDYLSLDEIREFMWMCQERDTILKFDWVGDFVLRACTSRQAKKQVILKKLELGEDLNDNEMKFMLQESHGGEQVDKKSDINSQIDDYEHNDLNEPNNTNFTNNNPQGMGINRKYNSSKTNDRCTDDSKLYDNLTGDTQNKKEAMKYKCLLDNGPNQNQKPTTNIDDEINEKSSIHKQTFNSSYYSNNDDNDFTTNINLKDSIIETNNILDESNDVERIHSMLNGSINMRKNEFKVEQVKEKDWVNEKQSQKIKDDSPVKNKKRSVIPNFYETNQVAIELTQDNNNSLKPRDVDTNFSNDILNKQRSKNQYGDIGKRKDNQVNTKEIIAEQNLNNNKSNLISHLNNDDDIHPSYSNKNINLNKDEDIHPSQPFNIVKNKLIDSSPCPNNYDMNNFSDPESKLSSLARNNEIMYDDYIISQSKINPVNTFKPGMNISIPEDINLNKSFTPGKFETMSDNEDYQSTVKKKKVCFENDRADFRNAHAKHIEENIEQSDMKLSNDQMKNDMEKFMDLQNRLQELKKMNDQYKSQETKASIDNEPNLQVNNNYLTDIQTHSPIYSVEKTNTNNLSGYEIQENQFVNQQKESNQLNKLDSNDSLNARVTNDMMQKVDQEEEEDDFLKELDMLKNIAKKGK